MEKISRSAFKHNFRELIFVFLAFAILVVTATISIGRILHGRLLDRTEEIIYTADANVRAGLSAAETLLLNSHHIVTGMIERDAPSQEIMDYLISTTEWMRRQDQGLLGFYGIYAFIDEEFYDSIGLNPGPDYIPQLRPWYQLAIRSGTATSYTTPYLHWGTEDIIVSTIRNIYSNNVMVGIIVVDININWLTEYISSLSPTAGGYGMLLSQNMAVMAHPNSDFMGNLLHVLGPSYNDIARTLRIGGNVSAMQILDVDGSSAIAFFNPISNGWFIGLVIPYIQFYWDLYVTTLILVILGIALSLTLSLILLRLSTEKMRSDEESKSKSSFLANMSHEIRTPMNAITGMAELALRENMPDTVREHVLTIRQAGVNLLSIINDILDFSKVEAGILEIIPINYMLSSLVNDVVNIIRNRISEKPIQFVVNIEGSIPNNLTGDEVRIRQILLNLLSNAAKYTEKGHISLSITRSNEEAPYGRVMLCIVVRDTGVGIKKEDQIMLFGEFIQLESEKHRGIEGTGLGLSITKRLCDAMGGNISMESEYGKGSSFTVMLPQDIDTSAKQPLHAPFAAVENAGEKKVLIYEHRRVYVDSLCWSLENLGVQYKVAEDTQKFEKAIKNEEWNFVFCDYSIFEEIREIMEKESTRPSLTFMVELETDVYIPDVHFIYMPMHTLSIANVLNDKEDNYYTNKITSNFISSFTLTQCRILVVDDTATNLKVAVGLLAPYNAIIETCLNGRDAIKMIKQHSMLGNNYDIIFMDHMMPEMDGIETTALIRALEEEHRSSSRASEFSSKTPGELSQKPIPIIALTANAVVGMREMFLSNGFNDFIAKPIDVGKLDEILERWIAKEKRDKEQRIERISLAASQGVNPELLEVFRDDAEKAINKLRQMNGDLKEFTTTVHSMKSALANIGEKEKSGAAADLEKAALEGNVEFIADYTADFIASLETLLKDRDSSSSVSDDGIEDTEYLIRELNIIELACRDYDDETAYAAFDRLKEKTWKNKTQSSLRELRNKIFLHSDFDGAAEQASVLSMEVNKEK